MTYPMGMPRERSNADSIPDYSPHQWMSGDYLGAEFSPRPETATPANAEAQSAVSQSYGNRDGHGVIDVPNMSYPGTHRLGD
jgi:hypothetical protein